MRALVTGVAGFIGSTLAERLLSQGHEVVGIDCFTDYYPRPIKEANLETARCHDSFKFIEGDLLHLDLAPIMGNVDWVFHEAAQAGVRASWGSSFEVYSKDNIVATQRLLEAAKDARLQKFVYASSSSIYGEAETYPTSEAVTPRPISPYGITKLAAEQLCYLYWRSFGVPTVSLRYFTVYGPRQRPDMAFNKFIKAILSGDQIDVYGDGEQTRDFTFVYDAVSANIAAAESGPGGAIINIGGGSRMSVNQTIAVLEEIIGKKAKMNYQDAQVGDARHTAADISLAQKLLGYHPTVRLREGLEKETLWLQGL
ncbi:MAG: NAD-dependent epimerase/dehydratase family protein [Dehalococcoidia bacterium]|nr:NAD-dependent epimerase/dehydratase family protein [Dehalococcoidia bacterium]